MDDCKPPWDGELRKLNLQQNGKPKKNELVPKTECENMDVDVI
jgi:hypothetical protein